MAIKQDITDIYFSGNDLVFTVTIKDENNVIVDLTGLVAATYFVARKPTSSSIVLTKTLGSGITVADAVNGVIQIVITNTDTTSLEGDFYHELKIENSSNQIYTVFFGQFPIRHNLV